MREHIKAWLHHDRLYVINIGVAFKIHKCWNILMTWEVREKIIRLSGCHENGLILGEVDLSGHELRLLKYWSIYISLVRMGIIRDVSWKFKAVMNSVRSLVVSTDYSIPLIFKKNEEAWPIYFKNWLISIISKKSESTIE